MHDRWFFHQVSAMSQNRILRHMRLLELRHADRPSEDREDGRTEAHRLLAVDLAIAEIAEPISGAEMAGDLRARFPREIALTCKDTTSH
jgi:hypothetical protein